MLFFINRFIFDITRINKSISNRQKQIIRRLQRNNQRTIKYFFYDVIHDEFVIINLIRMKRTLYI